MNKKKSSLNKFLQYSSPLCQSS